MSQDQLQARCDSGSELEAAHARIAELERELSHVAGGLEKASILEPMFVCASSCMLVVDGFARIKDINPAGEKLAGKPEEAVAGKMFGEVFDCLNTSGGQKCGASEACPQCPVRAVIEQTLRIREPVNDLEIRLTVLKQAGPETFVAVLSAVPIFQGEKGLVLITLDDITDRKQMEASLRESEERFAVAFRQNPVPLTISDIETGRFIDVNDCCTKKLGYSREEIIGRTSKEIDIWADFDARDSIVEKLVAQKYIWNEPVEFKTRSGKVINALWSAQIVTLENRQVMLSMIHDDTGRRQAEEALRLTQFAMDRASDSIIWIGDEGELVYMNDAACASLGYAREELLRMKVFDIDPDFPPENFPSHKEELRRVGSMRFESRHRARDGRIFPVEVTTNYFGSTGKFLACAFDRDITQRKQAEEQLKRLVEEQDILLNNIDVQVWYLTDARTYGALNTAHADFFGKDKGSLEHKSLAEIFSSEQEMQRCMEANRQVFENKQQIRTEEWMINGKGEYRLLAITRTPKLGKKGDVEYVVCFANDITEFRQIQEMMIQTEKMISVGGIAAGIAHEINNPLGIILQAAQNLVQRTRPDFPKNLKVANSIGLNLDLVARYMQERKLDVFIEDIQAAAMRAATIIRHMLDFARNSESSRSVCDLAKIIEKAVALAQNDYDLKKCYDFKKISVNLEFNGDVPAINCTETEIEQVILNLLRNAAQAMADVSPPLENPHIDILVSARPGGVYIEVRDNGPGVAPELLDRIFDPFFTTKEIGKGTGLGLSVSYFIVTKSHGGKMKVESQPGSGTRFIIELPVEMAREWKP